MYGPSLRQQGSNRAAASCASFVRNIENAEVRAVGYLLKIRSGGFMLGFPVNATVEAYFETLAQDGVELVVTHIEEVEAETTRGRQLGTAPVLLVDASWDIVDHFLPATVLYAVFKPNKPSDFNPATQCADLGMPLLWKLPTAGSPK